LNATAAVTGTSRGPHSALLYNLHAEHDPWRAARLAWLAGSDDNGLLGAPLAATRNFLASGDKTNPDRQWQVGSANHKIK
jgi:hypothetical protein